MFNATNSSNMFCEYHFDYCRSKSHAKISTIRFNEFEIKFFMGAELEKHLSVTKIYVPNNIDSFDSS